MSKITDQEKHLNSAWTLKTTVKIYSTLYSQIVTFINLKMKLSPFILKAAQHLQ